MFPSVTAEIDVFPYVTAANGTMRANTQDRIVLVSNYTQTLDLMQVMCRQYNWPCLRIDGSTNPKVRREHSSAVERSEPHVTLPCHVTVL